MDENSDIIPVSKIRIVPTTSNSATDALYSNPFEPSFEKPDFPLLRPGSLRYDTREQRLREPHSTYGETIEKKQPETGDSVSTGTFGNLVKKASNENAPIEDRAAEARHRIRYNLMKFSPKRKSGDRCEDWREFLF